MLMKRYLYFGLFILLTLALLTLAACEPASNGGDEAPPTVITLLPRVMTETPRFTATLPPSATPTASNTPLPTETPTPITPTNTPTLTPTPPVLAVAANTSSNVRVRTEPSNSGEVIVSIPPQTQVEVHYSSEDGNWIQVRFLDEDEQLVDGWIDARFLSMLGDENFVPPTLGPTPTDTGTPDPNTTPEVTRTPSQTPEVPPGENVSDENVRANCRQALNPDPLPTITAGESVGIWWNWFVAQPELMQDHLDHANYEVLLNGRLLTDYEKYATPLQREGRDWFIYWYYPVGSLEPGRYEVSYRVTWDAAVSDGYEDFGPGTENEADEGNCVFTVTE